MKVMIKMQEKLMEVPKNFLDDMAVLLRNLYAGHLAYVVSLEVKTAKFYLRDDWKNRVTDEQKNRSEKALEFGNKVFDYIMSQTEARIFNTIKLGKEVTTDFTMNQYTSKYGDLSKVKKILRVRYKKSGNYTGMFSPARRELVLSPWGFTKAISEFTGITVVPDEYTVYCSNDDWIFNLDGKIPQFLDYAVEIGLTTLEHEFIHLIQNFLFYDTIKDPNYSTTDMNKYYPSPYESNPWLVTSLKEYQKWLDKRGELPSSESIEQFIKKSQYFVTLKRNDMKLYNHMLKSFYQLVDERLGFPK